MDNNGILSSLQGKDNQNIAGTNLTHRQWYEHCRQRSPLANELITKHLANHTPQGDHLIWIGTIAALSPNDRRTDDIAAELWSTIPTKSKLTRAIHPIDNLIDIAWNRCKRATYCQAHLTYDPQSAAEPSTDNLSWTTNSNDYRRIELQDAIARLFNAANVDQADIEQIIESACKTPAERQRLRRARQRLTDLTNRRPDLAVAA